MTKPTVSKHWRKPLGRHTIQHRAVLIIFPLNLKTVSITLTLSSGGEGNNSAVILCVYWKGLLSVYLMYPAISYSFLWNMSTLSGSIHPDPATHSTARPPPQLGSAAQADMNTHTQSRQLICYLVTGTHYTQTPLNLIIRTHHFFKRTQVDPLYLSMNFVSVYLQCSGVRQLHLKVFNAIQL